MSSINAESLSSVEFTGEAGKLQLRVCFLSAGFPSTALTELVMERENRTSSGKPQSSMKQRPLTGPYLVCLAHSHPQKLMNQTNNKEGTEGVRLELLNGINSCKLCQHFSRILKLAIRMNYTASWYKMSRMDLKRLKEG